LQLRCTTSAAHQRTTEALLSPEAAASLFSSRSITSLYLENCGLLDDHMDAFAAHVPNNHVLQTIDVKSNLFSDDTLFTVAGALAALDNHTTRLTSIDMSGCQITTRAGQALAQALTHNSTITYLELEGEAERFQDEFSVPVSRFSQDDWMQEIYLRLRLNRALVAADNQVHVSKPHFVEALNSVNDQLDCVYHFVRTCPGYCQNTTTTCYQ
jgi:hypothetical protein